MLLSLNKMIGSVVNIILLISWAQVFLLILSEAGCDSISPFNFLHLKYCKTCVFKSTHGTYTPLKFSICFSSFLIGP